MDTVLMSHNTTGQTVSTVRYQALTQSSGSSLASDNTIRVPIPIAGTLKNFYIKYVTAAGGGLARTYYLRKNNVDQALSVTITDPAVSGSDTSNTVAIAAGDLVSIGTSATGTTASTGMAQYSLLFTSTTPGQSFVLAQSLNSADVSATNYMPIQSIGLDTIASRTEKLVPTSGVFRNAYLVANGAPTNTYTCTLYKNGVATSLVIVFTGAGATANNTANSVTVAAGDRFYWEIVPSGTPTARSIAIGMEFDPTVAGESIQCSGGGSTSLSTSAANYAGPQGGAAWSATESARQMLTQTCTIRNLYAYLATTTGAAKSYQFQASVNTVAGNPSVTITNGTTGSDLVNSVSVVAGDSVAIKSTPTNTPASTTAEYGVVTYIPVAPTTAGSMFF